MKTIHFIGGGQMAEAIIQAVTANHVIPADCINVMDINGERC